MDDNNDKILRGVLMPLSLYNEVKIKAKKDHRSWSGEMVAIVEAALAADKKEGKETE